MIVRSQGHIGYLGTRSHKEALRLCIHRSQSDINKVLSIISKVRPSMQKSNKGIKEDAESTITYGASPRGKEGGF